MALCSFDDPSGLLLSTPVENLFIEEYLPHAPAEYVKAYLYGLKLCYHPQDSITLERFARDIHLSEGTVRDAFSYWERQGIVRRISDRPLLFHYYSIQKTVMQEGDSLVDGLYPYQSYNNRLQAIFESRILSPQEYAMAADWIEILHMTEDAVLAVAEYYHKQKKGRISLTYLNSVMDELARDGVTTLSAVEERLSRRQPQELLRHLGIKNRGVSTPEVKLYTKWIEEWGFSHEAILAASTETAKAASPSFAYLESILSRLREAGALTPQEVRDYLNRTGTEHAALKAIFSILGSRHGPTEEMARAYRGYLEKGFTDQGILAVARIAASQGGRRFADVMHELDAFAAENVFSEEAILQLTAQRNAIDEEVAEFLEHADIDHAIQPRERALFLKWTEEKSLPVELVFMAAEQAREAKEKMSYIDKVLRDWSDRGIASVSAAKEHIRQHEAAIQAGRGKGSGSRGSSGATGVTGPLSKKVSAQNFRQREYTDADLEHLNTNLFDLLDDEELDPPSNGDAFSGEA